MSLSDQIQADLVAAMRAKDSFRLDALRMIKTAFKNKEVEKGDPLSEDDERKILETLVKQRREAATQFRGGGRQQLAEKEEQEMALIQGYLPAAATDDEIRAAIEQAMSDTGAETLREMGAVMKATRALLASKTVDGGRVSSLVKERLQSA
jgi:uncharacterized protein YqeY